MSAASTLTACIMVAGVSVICGLFLQAFMDGLQEVQAYLKTGVTPPGFSVMPISPEQAPSEAAAKMGKRPGSSKARDDPSGGPGISKDAGRNVNDIPAASVLVLLDMVCSKGACL